MNVWDEDTWSEKFAIELLRLGTRGTVAQLIELGRGYYTVEGSLNPVEVARREYQVKPPNFDRAVMPPR